MSMHILKKQVTMEEVRVLATEWYGTMIKGTVDIAKDKVALGGDYHMETFELLVKDGSTHTDVWGFNIRFDENQDGILEFDSLVNIKPALGNKSRSVEDPEIIEKATEIIRSWIQFRS